MLFLSQSFRDRSPKYENSLIIQSPLCRGWHLWRLRGNMHPYCLCGVIQVSRSPDLEDPTQAVCRHVFSVLLCLKKGKLWLQHCLPPQTLKCFLDSYTFPTPPSAYMWVGLGDKMIEIIILYTAQSVGGGAAHVLMFGLLHRGGRLCIDVVTKHKYSRFTPLNNYNQRCFRTDKHLRSGRYVSQSACSSLPFWHALTLHFNDEHHPWSQVIGTRTGLLFTLCWFYSLQSLWDTSLNQLHNTKRNRVRTSGLTWSDHGFITILEYRTRWWISRVIISLCVKCCGADSC